MRAGMRETALSSFFAAGHGWCEIWLFGRIRDSDRIRQGRYCRSGSLWTQRDDGSSSIVVLDVGLARLVAGLATWIVA